MRRTRNHAKNANTAFIVTARFDHSWFLPGMVEELASTRTEAGFNKVTVPADSQAIETSTIEAFVSGNLVFSDNDRHKHFTGGFLFTCIKPLDSTYKMVWCSSLS